jgi:hypothetical protein
MDRSLAPGLDVGKTIVAGVIGSASSVGPLLEDLDQQVRHRVRVAADRIDLFVRQFQRFVVQKLAASRDGYRVLKGLAFDDVLHRLVRNDLRLPPESTAPGPASPGPSRNCCLPARSRIPSRPRATPEAWAEQREAP